MIFFEDITCTFSDNLANRILQKYGVVPQLRMLQEESAELISSINHYLRNRENSKQEFFEELVDTLILIKQIYSGFSDLEKKELLKEFRNKLNRIEEKILDE